LNYFHRDAAGRERHFSVLAACHGSILKAFDSCFDGALGADPNKAAALNRFWAIAHEYTQPYRIESE
jgi:hypothetical protein